MDAILLAAGSGKRMLSVSPKQFLTIQGKPMFIYSLEVLRRVAYVDKIIITCNIEFIEEYVKYIKLYNIDNIECVEGGSTRQESVNIGLQHVTSDKILIHEAARPLISPNFIDSIYNSYDGDGIIPVIPIPFTVIEGGDTIEKELNRSRLHNVQLPQVFNTEKLKAVHNQAIEDNYQATEDGMLMFHYGAKVHLVSGRESNIKVTTPLDLTLVEFLLRLK